MVATKDYQGTLVFFFENGKAAKVELLSYETKTNRKKLVNAYSDKSPLVKMFCLLEDIEILLTSTQGRMLLVHTGAVPVKTTRSTQGVQVMTLRRSAKLQKAEAFIESSGILKNPQHYRKTIPAIGSLPSKEELSGEQLTF